MMPNKVFNTTGPLVPITPGLKKKHAELAVLWLRHGTVIDHFWRSLSHQQRVAAITSEDADDAIITSWRDLSKTYRGEPCRTLAPDWNLWVLSHRPEPLLTHITDRVNGTLADQCVYLLDDGIRGDCEVIRHSHEAARRYLGVPINNSLDSGGKFMLIKDGVRYGEVAQLDNSQMPATDGPFGIVCLPDGHYGVSWSLGRQALLRQEYLVTKMTSLLHHLVKLEAWIRQPGPSVAGWAREGERRSHVKAQELARPTQNNLQGLMAAAERLAQAAEAELEVLFTDPFAFRLCGLAERRNDLIQKDVDKYGLTGTHTSVGPRAACKVLAQHMTEAKHWRYIGSLLRLYQSAGAARGAAASIVATEMRASCRAYLRSAKDQVFLQFAGGLNGRLTVEATDSPLPPTKSGAAAARRLGPSAALVIELLISDMDAAQTTQWLAKLEVFYNSEPGARYSQTYHENQAICKVARLAAFQEALRKVVPLPRARSRAPSMWWGTFNREYSLAEYVDRNILASFGHLAVHGLRLCIYDGDYSLFEDGQGACRALAKGHEIGVLEPDNAKCLAQVEQLVVAEVADRQRRSWQDLLPKKEIASPPAPGQDVKEHKSSSTVRSPATKHKTRPAKPATPPGEHTAQETHDEESTSAPTPDPAKSAIKVKAQTAATFAGIFAKADARGSVKWTAFVSAMTDVGFAVMPKLGALTTFAPDADLMPDAQPFGMHRPHDGIVEGFRLMKMARRLTRRYGWDAQTFVEA